MNKWNVGIYIRLSQEDGDKEESNSVTNQRELINSYISEDKELNVYDYYIDDGWSGTNFDRPDFKRLIADVENNVINTIIVKDLSRFGRNYIEVGNYLEQIFPVNNIRFIAINDCIDSYKDPESINSIIVPFKNLMNDEYCRDISQKVKYALNTRKRNGEFMGSMIPYGYIRSTEDKHKLVIDDEAAKVVKKIFKNALKGLGTTAIARKLNKDGIITPSLHKINVLKIKCNYRNSGKSNYWNDSMVAHILRNRMYLGEMVQCKYKTVSYKIHKRVKNNKENWIIIKGTHEALVSKEDFKWIQEKYYSKIIQIRRKNHDYALFSGFLICNDCHRGLYYLESRRPRKDGSRLKYYICGTNKVNSKGCTPHRIKEDDLIEIVRKSINKQIKLVTKLNDDLELISKNKKLSIKGDILLERKNTLSESINQKMKLKQSLYTDWKEEIITFEDYKNYSSSYNNEILEIRETIKIIDKELEELDNIPNYQVDLIKLFNNKELFKKIDRDILFKFIECIYIFEDKKVEIVFKYQDIYQNLLEYVKKNKSYLKPA